MEEMAILGVVITSVITLGGLFTVFYKATKPVNDLNLNIIRLNETIKTLLENEKVQNKRLDKHAEQIDELKLIVCEHSEKLKNMEDK